MSNVLRIPPEDYLNQAVAEAVFVSGASTDEVPGLTQTAAQIAETHRIDLSEVGWFTAGQVKDLGDAILLLTGSDGN